MLTTGTVFENRYRVVGQMTSGGFADIYVGCDSRLGNKPVIIKVLRRDFAEDRERIQMFLDEINLATRLDHENIVRVYDIIKTEEDTYFQILELIEGLDLKQMISDSRQQNQQIHFDLVAYIISKVCLALDYAHEKKDTASGSPLNLVHRDISPSNILVSFDGKVKLTDFGIAFAHLHQRQKTRMGELKGKISYMSPEQVRGQKVDRRSDLYSLGIVMYEAMAGRRLFDGDSDIEVLQKVADGSVDLHPIENAKVPDVLQKILVVSLEKKAADRYQTSFEMYTDLQKHLSSIDEYILRAKLKDYLSGLRKETRLSQLLGVIKGEIKEESAIELTLPPSKEGEEEQEEERTIYDLIRLQTGRGKKIWTGITLSLLVAAFAFAGIDTFSLRKTPIGKGIYNKLFPPALFLESIPEKAKVSLNGQAQKGVTPLSISKIQSGTYTIEMELDGYNPIRRTINIEGKKEESTEPQKILYPFEIPLLIESNPPGAKIYFDNNIEPHPEVSPVTIIYPLQNEPLTLRFEHEGFEDISTNLNLLEKPVIRRDLITKESRIKDENEIFQYSILVNFYTEVTVFSDPEDAYVNFIHNGDESEAKETPVTLLLVAGRSLLKVEKDGWFPWEQEIIVENAESVTLNAKLKKEVSLKAFKGDIENEGIPYSIYQQGQKITTGKTPKVDTLEAGIYEVKFNVPKGFKTLEPITFRVPGREEISAELTEANPLLKVSVIDASTNRRLPGSIVWLRFRETEEWKTYTAPEGTYQRRIPEGKFYIAASAPSAGFELSPYEERTIQWPSSEVAIHLTRQTKPKTVKQEQLRPEIKIPLGPTIKVPDLIGKDAGRARNLLKSRNLELSIVPVNDKKYKKFKGIFLQKPKAGSRVKKGTTVKAYIYRKN
jgi:serine/threonine-protein kinase